MSDLAARIVAQMADLAAQLRLVDDLGGSVLIGPAPGAPLMVLPGAVIGPPGLEWDAYSSSDPNGLRLIVYVVVPADAGALEKLWSLVPRVVDAIERGQNMVTISPAVPGSYMSGQTQLPAYEITVEVSL